MNLHIRGMERMKWTDPDIERLFEAADFSAGTDLKERLLEKLSQKYGLAFEEARTEMATSNEGR